MKTLGSEDSRGYGRASPADLIAWVLALDERDQQDERDRGRLDREIRAALQSNGGDRRAILRSWIVEAPSISLRDRITRVRTSLSLVRLLFLAVGLFVGWGAAAALLQVEVHEGRINIVLCVGLLVVLPVGMLVMGCLGALLSKRSSRAGRQGGQGFDGGWRSFALARFGMSLLSSSVRQDVELVLGRLSAHSRLYSGVQRAQVFVWSQWLGSAFAAGVLIATLAFVVFTDLAFGWSTTLDVEPASVHRFVRLAASPWAGLWPEASPPLELVETTRHFRVSNEEHIHFVDPIHFGGWWPFLVASLAFYGLLPRIVVLGLGSRWLGREVGDAILRTPGVDLLLGRLTTPIVESQATGPEGEIGHAERGWVPIVHAADWLRGIGGERPTVIRWAEASDDAALVAALGVPRLQVRDAGGRRSLEEDSGLVASIVESDDAVLLCVRAYEPPVLDVLDFLSDLRRGMGDDRGLCVLLAEGTPSDHQAWRNRLIGLADPGLRVALLVTADPEPLAQTGRESSSSD